MIKSILIAIKEMIEGINKDIVKIFDSILKGKEKDI